MNANTLMPKEFISGADVFDATGKKSLTLGATIADVKSVSVGQGDDKEDKWALTFKGTDRKLTLNKTNLGALIEFFGAETDDWKGQHIALVGTWTEFAGKTVKAVRIRPQTEGATPLVEDDIKTFDPEAVPF